MFPVVVFGRGLQTIVKCMHGDVLQDPPALMRITPAVEGQGGKSNGKMERVKQLRMKGSCRGSFFGRDVVKSYHKKNTWWLKVQCTSVLLGTNISHRNGRGTLSTPSFENRICDRSLEDMYTQYKTEPNPYETPTAAQFKGDHFVLHVISRKDLSDQEAVGKVAFHISHTAIRRGSFKKTENIWVAIYSLTYSGV